MELSRRVPDFLGGWRWPRVVGDLIHTVPQQGANPRLHVPLRYQNSDRLIVPARLHAESLERI
jgi:hypothetical protein